jgi:hypothetical protein
VDHSALEKHALSFQGASGRIRPDSFTASLRLVPGPYQVLVTVPWRGESPDQIAASLADVLRQDPRAWDSVQYLPQEKGLPVPPIAGPGWRHWNWPGRSQGEASEPGG